MAKLFGRSLLICAGLAMAAFGGLALAGAELPDQVLVAQARDGLLRAAIELAARSFPEQQSELPIHLDFLLSHVVSVYGVLPVGALLLYLGLRSRPGLFPEAQQAELDSAEGSGNTLYSDPKNDKKLTKKVGKEAGALAKAGRPLEAAEHCFNNGLYEEAAGFFIAGEDHQRAAEIRHDQNRFIESAELYLKAGKGESAGVIFAQQEEFLRSAEAYHESGNLSVAAEMYEKAGEFRRAADAYAKSGFPRHAAKAYSRCRQWKQAAACLEEAIRDESTGARGNEQRLAEVRQLVMMCGGLYERAELLEQAQAVLARGECFAAAAEVALRAGNDEQAAELLLKACDVPGAADALRRLGREEEADRYLAEFYRDHGQEELAAKHFEAAGDLLAAGDLYRLLGKHIEAGEVYDKFGDAAQAAEMFAVAGDRARAAEAYERAGCFTEAAECHALSGDTLHEAELLVRAGSHLRAGEIYVAAERSDDAIKALQEVTSDHPDFAAASAILGRLFRERGMLSLAIKKLKAATDGQEITRLNVDVFYGLATCTEETGDPAAATDLYEKILVFDYNFEDAAERLAKVQEQSRAASVSTPFSASGRDGRYKINGTLGRGGMGIVYRAEDTVLDRIVAFKVLPDTLQENPQALKNFLREAKSAAALNHPNIVTIYDAGEQDGIYYIAMEFVDGNTLKEIVKHRGKISTAGVVHVLAQLSEALAYAHEKKIVHRDIKTANAMWTRERKAKIMDFGLAKAVEEVRNHTTVVSGTPYYMSPEQTLGKNVDQRTDIYSLGVTTFEMATGRLPFTEGNLPYHHVHTPPPDPREFSADVAPLIAEITLRCMQKDPAARFQSAHEIVELLKSSLSGHG